MTKFIVRIFAAVGMVASVSADTLTWIGGSAGAALSSENWDPNGEPHRSNAVQVTNSVTFAENTADDFWRISSLSVLNNSTVTFKARFWAAEEKYLTSDKEMFVDIDSGSTLKIAYMIGASPVNKVATCTFVRRGGGTLDTTRIGSYGNLFKSIRLESGLTKVSDSTGLRATTAITISDDAQVAVSGENCVDTQIGTSLVTVDGLLNCCGKIQTIDGLAGSGVVTNADKGLVVQLRSQGQNEFSGKIFGKLSIVPHDDAPAGAYLVVGDADTLRNADLFVTATVDNPDPIRFKPGIGVFYARDFPRGCVFRDTDGNPVELRHTPQPAKHFYVSCDRPDDSGDGLTPENAFKTLKAALANENLAPAPELNIVHVAPGVYDSETMGSGNDLSRAQVPGNVRLVSDEGPEKTIIKGRPSDASPEGCKGCGPEAVRCVKLLSGARIEGFTLTGGYTYATGTDSGNYGGGVDCANTSCYVVNCVISNNVARRGGGGHKGTYIRSRILSNTTTSALGTGLYLDCYLYNCVVDDNAGIGFYAGGSRAIMVNCIFGTKGTSIRADGTDEGARSDAYNTIFMSDILSNKQEGRKLRLHNCLTMAALPSDVDVDEDCIVTNGFAAASEKLTCLGFDESFRPVAAIPGSAVNGGNIELYRLLWNENASIRKEDLTIDLDGNARVAGGVIDLGPYEADFARTFVMIDDKEGGISVEGAAAGITEVGQGESVTVTIKRTFESDRLCVGFTVNGEFVDFEDYPDGWTVNIEGGDLSNSLVIQTKYVESTALYVDAENGNDANRGYHPACARKTLAAAFTPAPGPGTVVYAAPGWYTNETMSVPENNFEEQLYRVVIPDGVSLVSLEGADRTFIGGKSSDALQDDSRAQGCGAGAVACVKLLKATSGLRGFTCFGGRTNLKKTDDGHTGISGGGVNGPGKVEDCLFVDCRAYRGGGAYMATAVRRCRFVDCSAVGLGAAVNECLEVYNCVFDACTNGTYVASYSKPIVNSVFLPSCGANTAVYYIKDHPTYPYSVSNVMNSAVFCAPFKAPVYTCCAFMQVSDIEGVSLGEGSIVVPAGRFTVLDVADMNADGSLRGGSSLIDAGSNLLYRASGGGIDYAKGQRVYNGTIDIGAYEYDWRGEFARALQPSRWFTVVEAGANVTEDAGGISLSGGDTVRVRWEWSNGSLRDIAFEVAVSGEGVFSYSLSGGEPVTVGCTGGKAEVVLKKVSAPMDLKMEFSGVGTALISSFMRGDNGVKLIVR